MKSTIFYSEAGLEIVTNPFLVGDELSKKARKCSVDFWRLCLSPDRQRPAQMTVLNILRGGRYYHLIDAFKMATKEGLKTSVAVPELAEIRASRFLNEKSGQWQCKVWFDESVSSIDEKASYANLISNDTIVIGDTIATGATLVNVLEWLVNMRAQAHARDSCEKGHGQRHAKKDEKALRVIIFSMAGSSCVFERLAKLMERYPRSILESIHVYMANGAWKLDANGTDLAMMMNDDERDEFVHPRAWSYLVERCHGEGGLRRMKCAIHDWGDRFDPLTIDHHLDEVASHFSHFKLTDLPLHIRDQLLEYRASRRRSKL